MKSKRALHGAGMLIIAPGPDGKWRILLGYRKYGMGKGKLSIPWGTKEHTDATYVDCAIRETQEEVAGAVRDWLKMPGVQTKQRSICIPLLTRYTCLFVILPDIPADPLSGTDDLASPRWYSIDDIRSGPHNIFFLTRVWIFLFGVNRCTRMTHTVKKVSC